MVLTAEELVAAPRGRGVCLAVAEAWGEVDAWGWRFGEELADPAGAAATLAAELDAVDLGPLAHLGPDGLVRAVQDSVDSAVYWQPPWAHDRLLALPQLHDPLLRVAAAVVGSPAARWWSSPVDPSSQHQVLELWDDEHVQEMPRLDGVAERVRRSAAERRDDTARARRERPRDVRASWGGRWWSTPADAGPPTTSRVLGELPVGLWWTEDDARGSSLARAVRVVGEPRVLELDGPDDWVALVREHPLDVTAGVRHDWWRAVGLDVAWAMPDWAAVAEHHDAVHLTVAGYLTTATRPLVVDGDVHTLLAGASPDETTWLADVLLPAGEPVRWDLEDDDSDGGDYVWRVRG